MSHESMVRCLDAQARAIWPQEMRLFGRYDLPAEARILDAGCGTGEISWRLTELYPAATVLGIDIVDSHLELARSRYTHLAARLTFDRQSVFALDAADGSFDLTVCRHVIHAVPHADRVLAELVRVTRPGGYLHLIPEDYGMLHFERPELQRLWSEAPAQFGAATGTDLSVGRHTPRMLLELGLEEVAVDYVVVDTYRVARETFAQILQAWSDGYCEVIGQFTSYTAEEAANLFEQMIADIKDPHGYAVWMVPVVSAQIPGSR